MVDLATREKQNQRLAVWSRRIQVFLLTQLLTMTVVMYSYTLISSVIAMPIWPVTWILTITVYIPIPLSLAAARRAAPLPYASVQTDESTRAMIWRHFHWLIGGLFLFGLWAGLYFFGNQSAAASEINTMYTMLDLILPFMPHYSFIYLTVYWVFLMGVFGSKSTEETVTMLKAGVLLIVISVGFHMAFPVGLARPEFAVTNMADWTLAIIYSSDLPVSCFPSTHCGMAMFAGLVAYHRRGARGLWVFAMALGIGLATLLTKQHYVADVIGGYVLALASFMLVYARKLAASPNVLKANHSMRQY